MPPSSTGVIVLAHGQWFAEIAGVPLLHRVLLSSRKAGVRRWLVLTQHEAPWVHASLATAYKLREVDRKSTRLNSSHIQKSRMPSSA